ncbi:MAG: TadE/TadG family type IV pilus assembly protein [Rhizobiaceae bacterium]
MTIANDTLNTSGVPPKRGLFGRFKKDKRGSVAIEFAMLVLPFSMLVFAIIESCVSFAAQQVMANAADNIGRQIRVGNLRTADATPIEVRKRICEQMSLLVTSGCPGLVYDLKSYASFADVPTTIPRTPTGDVSTSGFTTSVAGQLTVHHLRIFYRWPYVTDFIGHKLAELPDNKTLLYSSMTWMNEPYDI